MNSWQYAYNHGHLSQAKLIIFLFLGFQNNMRKGGHFSLFNMTKILKKQFLSLISAMMKNL